MIQNAQDFASNVFNFSISSNLTVSSDDSTVRIWEMNPEAKNSWTPKVIDFSSRGTPWQTSWSPCGDFLAVSCGEGAVSLWYRDMNSGDWVQKPKISDINQAAVKEAAVAHL
jgi:WD40 repeat protein